jgi:hypothetical protein
MRRPIPRTAQALEGQGLLVPAAELRAQGVEWPWAIFGGRLGTTA